MKQLKFLFTVLFLAVLGLGNAWGAADYTLDATLDANKGKDNGYATAEDITVGDITWNVTGNSTMSPWRIGGKNLSGVDRAVYSKTAYASAVSKIDLTVGAASSVTVNSLKLVYSTNADFSSSTEISGTFAVNSTISFTPASGDFPANAFYKFVFNVTIGSSNKFIEFKKVEFYNATSGNPDPEVPTLSSIAVKTAPTKVAYTEGENFDPAGLVITKTMSDDNTEDVSYAGNESDFTFAPVLTAALTPANNKVTITYGGKTVDQAITVTAAPFTPTAGTYEIVPNNALWGTSHTGTAAGVTKVNGSKSGIAIELSKGTSSSSMYINDAQSRAYSGYTLKVTAPKNFDLTAITFTADGSNWAGTHTASVGQMTDNKHWTGKANEVTITFAGTCRCTKITVTYAEHIAASVATPELSVAAGTFYVAQNVKVSNYDAALSYYYTLDGTAPTNESAAYDHAAGIDVTASATLKVIAYDAESNASEVASAAYVIVPVYASLAELVAAGAPTADGETVRVSFTNEEITSLFVSGAGKRQGVFVKSGTQEIEFYCGGTEYPEEWAAHGHISATNLEGKWTLYKSTTWELVITGWTAFSYVAPEEEPTTPTYASLQALLDAEGEPSTGGKDVIVSFENQKITRLAGGAKGIYMMVGEQEIEIYCNTANPADPAWETRGLVSATELTASWKKYNSTWELVVADWTGISYTTPAPLVLTGLAISGEATALEYAEGDEFNPAGLTITATYNNGEETKTITNGFDWEFTPATLSAGQTSVSVVAKVDEISSEAFVVNGLTVAKALAHADWVANAQGYENADPIVGSAIKHETTTVATVTFDKATGTTAPAYYTTGSAARAYGGNTVTVAALKGFTMKKIVLSFATGEGTNAITAGVGEYADGEWNGSASEVTFTIGGTSGHRRISTITVYYEGELATPTGIVLTTETVKKEFAFGEEFNSDNLKVEAVYADETKEDVTLAAEVVAPDMTTPGTKTVTVNYLTFSETYTITVAAPTPVLTVDKEALAFGTVNLNAEVEAKTVAVTLENLAAATVALSGEGAAKFAIDVTSLTESGNVTVSATANAVGEFSATLTISGEGAETKTVALSMTVVDLSKVQKEDVDFTEVYSSLTGNQTEDLSEYEGASYTITFTKNDGTQPKYYANGSAARVYNKNTITIEAVKNIYMVEVTYAGKSYVDEGLTENVANNYHGYVVCDGTSNQVVLTATATSRITDITVYYEDQKEEVRAGLVSGKYGTICVEKMTLAPKGAHFYTLNYYDEDAKTLYVNENTTGRLEAGVPYIYEAEGANIEGIVVADDEAAKKDNGFYAVLGEDKVITAEEAAEANIYGIVNNTVRPAAEGATIKAGRCYIQIDEVPDHAAGAAPARAFRVISGTNNATGLEGLEAIEGAVKVLHNGQIVILRDGKIYSVSGQIVK